MKFTWIAHPRGEFLMLGSIPIGMTNVGGDDNAYSAMYLADRNAPNKMRFVGDVSTTRARAALEAKAREAIGDAAT